MDRRDFLKLAVLSTSGFLLLDGNGWAARATDDDKNHKRLVVVFLRGAVDGLNVVVPYSDSSYYVSRPTIAVPRPNESGGALRLDSHFGLHPTLTSILPLWEKGTLAFVHASGSPDPSRSHFDAQDYMETATPGLGKTPDGWLNRLLGVLPGTRSSSDFCEPRSPIPASMKPRNRLPESPRKMDAGWKLKHRNPTVAPARMIVTVAAPTSPL